MLAHIKLKISTEKKIIGSFYETELLLSKLQMSYYPQPDSHNSDKAKLVTELPNYSIKK